MSHLSKVTVSPPPSPPNHPFDEDNDTHITVTRQNKHHLLRRHSNEPNTPHTPSPRPLPALNDNEEKQWSTNETSIKDGRQNTHYDAFLMKTNRMMNSSTRQRRNSLGVWRDDSMREQMVQEVGTYNRKPQYRLIGRSITPDPKTFRHICRLPRLPPHFTTLLTTFLHWTFRTTFFRYILATIVLYAGSCLVFAMLLVASLQYSPSCISPSMHNATIPQQFQNAWTLSWTTFSTVGYGLVSPATPNAISYINDPSAWVDDEYCSVVSFIGSFEAFMGIMFVGFFGAIVFGKITKIHGKAQVLFSHIVVVRLDDPHKDQADNPNITDYNDQDMTYKLPIHPPHYTPPTPILEFRIVNRLYTTPGGEIVNAKLNVVASLVSKNVDPSFFSDRIVDPSVILAKTKLHESHRVPPPNIHTDNEAVIYIKLQVSPDQCSFFERVWNVRHILDESSPLLHKSTRTQLQANHGVWPAHSSSSLEHAIHFDQILVTFSGLSNATATPVYAQKVYNNHKDQQCLKIGWQFVNMLFVNRRSGKLEVNVWVLDDVKKVGMSDDDDDDRIHIP